ncbi:hypothetical protein F5X99DRAFT_413325 [Biscogniauxia marginata]|nr:hypothetical protein F5X99DRAFT_413325 [Biscogniauxia marginata]
MPSDKEFHLFSKLPVEIQHVIWSFYNETQPIIRHCFSIRPKGRKRSGRAYAAFDEENRLFVDRTGKQKDDAEFLNRQKIKLVGKVLVLDESSQLPADTSALPAIYQGRTVPLSPAYIWVNFDHDIFYFGRSRYGIGRRPHVHYTEDWFRFLSNPIDAKIPPILDDGHWIFQVRKLALNVPPASLPMPQSDMDILSRAKRLRKLFIVAGRAFSYWNPGPYFGFHHGRKGFMSLSEFPQSIWSPDTKPAIEIRDSLVKLFQEHQNKVEVEVVVDSC